MLDRHWIGIRLTPHWHQIGTGLTSIDDGFVLDWRWIGARALRGGLALTTDWQLIGGRLVLDWQHTVFWSEPGLVPYWYWYCAGLTSMHHGLARFRQSKMGSRLASDSSRIGALALHWRLDTGLAVIANLCQSSPICQSGGNPLIPRNYKQSRLTWIGVIGCGKSGVLYIDWQCIGIELAVDRPLGKI